MKLQCSANQILAMKSKFVSFDLLQVTIRPFSNNRHVCAPVNKKYLILKDGLWESLLYLLAKLFFLSIFSNSETKVLFFLQELNALYIILTKQVNLWE